MKLILGSEEYIKSVNKDYQIQIGLDNEFINFDEDKHYSLTKELNQRYYK